MRIPNSSREKNPELWRKLRREGITATDIGALYAGKKTIAQLYTDKHSDRSFDNPYMQWGRLREPEILRWLQDEIETVIEPNDDLFAYDADPFFLSTPDGIGPDFVVEVKTIGRGLPRLEAAEAAGAHATEADFEDDGILNYFGQIQQQMLSAPRPLCIFVWEYRENRLGAVIPRRVVDDVDDLFMPGEKHFVCVDLSGVAKARCLESGYQYKEYRPIAPYLSADVWDLQDEIEGIERDIKSLRAVLEEKKNTLKARVTVAMKPGECFEYPLGTVRYTEYASRGSLDTEKLEEVLPGANAAIKECTRPGKPVTRITVKRRREGE